MFEVADVLEGELALEVEAMVSFFPDAICSPSVLDVVLAAELAFEEPLDACDSASTFPVLLR